MITSDNPLMRYMQAHNIRPYSRASDLLDAVGVFYTYLGDIATDKKIPTIAVLLRIEDATEGDVSAADMIKHFKQREKEAA